MDFLADLTQHIPPRGRPTQSHHGWLASALARDAHFDHLPQLPRC